MYGMQERHTECRKLRWKLTQVNSETNVKRPFSFNHLQLYSFL